MWASPDRWSGIMVRVKTATRPWRLSHDGPLKEIVRLKNYNSLIIYSSQKAYVEGLLWSILKTNIVRLLERFGLFSLSLWGQDYGSLFPPQIKKRKKIKTFYLFILTLFYCNSELQDMNSQMWHMNLQIWEGNLNCEIQTENCKWQTIHK